MRAIRFPLLLAAVCWAVNFGVAADAPASSTPAPGTALEGEILPPIQPTEPRRVVPPAPAIPMVAPTGQLPDNVVAWDAAQKEETIQSSQVEAHFKFNLTNVSSEVVTIHNVATSCGCTTAHLPPMPWKLAPGTNGEINVTMNVAGKSGTVFKTVTVSTDKGNRQLMVKTIIVAPPAGQPQMGERERNQQLALLDRQAVFKGDCARCHVASVEGKMGKELFDSTCAICHVAEHRASMVPDLQATKQGTARELWRVWVTYGKPGSLMPAFAKSQGGPLTEAQITSLVDYLAQFVSSKPAAPAPPQVSTSK